MELLHQLNSAGTTICMVTHDPHYAANATRVIKLRDGQLTS
jgi:putative ABC transport system ATP-binding protein